MLALQCPLNERALTEVVAITHHEGSHSQNGTLFLQRLAVPVERDVDLPIPVIARHVTENQR
jgi:hypothetical protein